MSSEFNDLLMTSDTRSCEPVEEICRKFCDINNGSTSNGSVPLARGPKLVMIEHLTVLTPSKATLIGDLWMEICEKDQLLVTGPSGNGKTSLLRALAGLWSFGRGIITFYDRNALDPLPSIPDNVASSEVTLVNEIKHDCSKHKNRYARGVFFLPQKPYMLLGTLRQLLLYPAWRHDAAPMSDSAKPTDSLPFLMHPEDMDARSMKPTTDDLIHVLEDV